MSTKLNKAQLKEIQRLASTGVTAQVIASQCLLTMHEAYASDAFCIAFSKGVDQRPKPPKFTSPRSLKSLQTRIRKASTGRTPTRGSTKKPAHDCMAYAVPCSTGGPIGHGWECGKCGNFLQVG